MDTCGFWKVAKPKLDKILTKYWKRQLKVEPAAYFEQLSFIKSRLYAQE